MGNRAELDEASDPLDADTDDDGLDDGRELLELDTDPTSPDSDDDRLADASELRLGTDPRDPDTDDDGILDGDETYTSTTSFADSGVSVAITGVGDVAATVTQVDQTPIPFFNGAAGLLSPVVDIETPQPFTTAALTIPFDPAKVPGGDLSGVGVMFYDEEAGTWVPLDGASTVVDPSAGTVTAVTDHFTTFAVFFIPEWQAVIDAWDPDAGTGRDAEFIDVALVLDSSGSMTSNDPAGLRRTAAKSFIDALIDGDQVAVVDFDSGVRTWQPLTTDFAAAKAAVDRVDSSGGTNIGAGVGAGLDQLITHGAPDHARLMILLTDGEGSYSSSLTQRAIDNDVAIYTIGLGSGVDEGLLRGIAEQTGGQYFPVAEADDLPEVFSRISLDPDGDHDGDGIRNGSELDGIVTGSGQRYVLNPFDPDTDGDGLLDGEELYSDLAFYVTLSDPLDADTDGDQLLDGDEHELSLSPLQSDRDRDDLPDGVEVHAGFDPRSRNGDGDPFRDDAELDRGSDPYSYDLDGADQGRAFVAGALLGELGDNIPAFDTSLKDLAGDLVELAPDIRYVSDGLRNIADGVSKGLVNIGCGANDVLGWLNPLGGGPGDAACEVLNFRVKYDPAYMESIPYLGGWIALSTIPFVDIVTSIRDVIGLLIDGAWVGAGLEVLFAAVGFFVPVIGDIAPKVGKFLARSADQAGAVLRFIVERWRAAEDLFLPLVKRVWGLSDDELARIGGHDGVIELGENFVNTKTLDEWLELNPGNRISRVSVNDDAVLDGVRTNWDQAARGASERTIRNLAAEAASTEAAVRLLTSRGYDVLFTSRNVPLELPDGSTRSIVNGPDIIARSPSGDPVVIEVKGSNQPAGMRMSQSTITNSAGVQTSRDWLLHNPGGRYLTTLRNADDAGANAAADVIDEIIGGADYDVVIVGASRDTRFGGTMEEALTHLDNRARTEVVEIDLSTQALDDAYQALRP